MHIYTLLFVINFSFWEGADMYARCEDALCSQCPICINEGGAPIYIYLISFIMSKVYYWFYFHVGFLTVFVVGNVYLALLGFPSWLDYTHVGIWEHKSWCSSILASFCWNLYLVLDLLYCMRIYYNSLCERWFFFFSFWCIERWFYYGENIVVGFT